MRLALMTRAGRLDFIEDRLRDALPEAEIVHWPDAGAMIADVAICWDPLPGTLARMPNLRLIHSIGAGVDNLIADPELPRLPVCRIRDDDLAFAMAEYVHWGTLWFHRQFDRILRNAAERKWERFPQQPASSVPVGILGLGSIGSVVARQLSEAGYPVHGWSRRQRALDGIACHTGSEGLSELLAASSVLVCLLPLTPDTRGLLNAERLFRLPQGAGLILCSRGEHLVRDDLVALLRSGHLRGAILDVFEREPLQPDDPLWAEPGVLVTPHMSALAKPRRIAEQIAANVRRLEAGLPLQNAVDLNFGY